MMGVKLTHSYIKSQFEKEVYQLLTENYINNQQKLEYICPEGHRGSITWANFQQGYRCPEYSGKKKKTIEFIRAEFEKRRYQLLTTKYVNSKTPLEYICPKGHKGRMSWNSFRRGVICGKCFRENKKGENHPNWKGGVKKLNIPLYGTYAHQIDFCEEIRRDSDNEDYLQVRCTETSCRKWFTPTTTQINNRIAALNNSIRKNRFYCSDECKQKCLIFGQQKYPKNCKPDYLRPNNRVFKLLVFERDNYECQRCKSKENLEVHHLFNYRDYEYMRTIVGNGIALCQECHNEFHSIYGKENNTIYQFFSFKKEGL